jgi:hypothetical protein
LLLLQNAWGSWTCVWAAALLTLSLTAWTRFTLLTSK